MNPPNENGPAGSAHSLQGRNENTTTKQVSTARVQATADERHTVEQTRLPLRYPAAYVSLYAPHASRRTWWYCYVCDHCKHGHQGQLRHATDEESAEQAVRGVRRSRCGRLLWFVVARTYRGQSSEVAA